MLRTYHLALSIIIATTFATRAVAEDQNAPSIAQDCGQSFLELPSSLPKKDLIWTAYGEEFDSFFGITAYSNGTDKDKRYYQCTELAHRFIREVYGIPTRLGMGLGHGNSVAQNVANHFSDSIGFTPRTTPHKVALRFFPNKTSQCRPVVGSVVSMDFGKYGHVAVIRHLKTNEDGTLEGVLFEQHGATSKPAGTKMEAGKLVFKKTPKGNWSGTWIVADKFQLGVVGWTNPTIVETVTQSETQTSPSSP